MDNFDWGMIASGIPTPGMTPGLPAVPPLPMLDPATALATQGVPPPNTNMTSPIAPEVLAKNAAARGIPPPPVDLPLTDVGAALTGNVPIPRGRPAMGGGAAGPGAPMDIRSQAQMQGEAAPGAQPQGGLADTLKGVRAPAGPELQRLGTPAAPRPTTQIKGGDLVALMQMLNAGAPAGGLQLPATLPKAFGK